MKISAALTNAYEFACHSAACRPPTSGGTGGSNPSGRSSRVAATLQRGQAALSKVSIGGKSIPAKAAPSFRTSGKKVLDSSGKQVGTWTRTGDGNMWEIAVKGGQRATLGVNKAIGRTKQTSYNADRVQGSTKREALAALDKRLADRQADVRTTGKVGDVFVGGVKGEKREQAIKAGDIKVSQVSVGRDGTVKLKGQPSDFKIIQGYDSRYRKRYQVEGINISAARLQSFKTQAAAKAAIVKQIKATQAATAS